MSESLRLYTEALSLPSWRFTVSRLDGAGWQYGGNVKDPTDLLTILASVADDAGSTPVRIIFTYCDPLIYAVPDSNLPEYGEAGVREITRRAAL